MADKMTSPFGKTSSDVCGFLGTLWKKFLQVSLFFAAAGLIIAWINGCGDITGNMSGEKRANIPPIVEFANVPAHQDTFSFAPVIYWKGSDKDGFVEYFEYADIIDSTALADPDYFIDFIPEESWVRTGMTANTIYLLTESGQITEHVFYLKCVDDQDTESEVIYRTFYRTNEPPNVPLIKWFEDNDEHYSSSQMLEDTLYVLDEVTTTWPGLGFTWKSSDPDDRDLYAIPLEYKYYLEKVPHDTVWRWVSQTWTANQDLTITGLDAGHYTLTVWARDDGFELSTRPASITFDVFKPSFEKSILLLDCTKWNGRGHQNRGGDVVPGHQIGDVYKELVSEVSTNYPDWEYRHFPDDIDTLNKSFLGQYRLIIWFSENHTSSGAAFESDMRKYVNVGGRLWVLGAFTKRNLISNTTMGLAGSVYAGPPAGVNVPSYQAEFVGAQSGVTDLPDLTIDTEKIDSTWQFWFNTGYKLRPLLPGVDILTVLGTGTLVRTETAYYFKSYTDTASGDVFDTTAIVVDIVQVTSDSAFYYPPTPLDCLIKLPDKRVRNVSRVFNQNRNEYGEVVSITNNLGQYKETYVRVSYQSGEPWSLTDVIRVDYSYLPFSDFHFKPCAVRFERLQELDDGGFTILYRAAVFTFPLYFLDNTDGSVSRMFRQMLNWFFLPYAH